jgi:hypothetical protein
VDARDKPGHDGVVAMCLFRAYAAACSRGW